jgi:ribosomal protein S27E
MEPEQTTDEELEQLEEEQPTVLFCPKCDSTEIIFVGATAECLTCGHQWN